ncbi:hypothetical protein ULG90_24605 [Halopseudomonas pachastrellae]|nr:hypothetical protein ULG90_24605 [Halopseudomonas pachastrellae]
MVGPSTLILDLGVMAAAVIYSSPWLFTLATLATASGAGATGVVGIASISNTAPVDQRGSINSAFYLMAYLTMASVVLAWVLSATRSALPPRCWALRPSFPARR